VLKGEIKAFGHKILKENFKKMSIKFFFLFFVFSGSAFFSETESGRNCHKIIENALTALSSRVARFFVTKTGEKYQITAKLPTVNKI
jgi:TRAP-type mannitol/chloroaromatic compound transport system permease large subunit